MGNLGVPPPNKYRILPRKLRSIWVFFKFATTFILFSYFFIVESCSVVQNYKLFRPSNMIFHLVVTNLFLLGVMLLKNMELSCETMGTLKFSHYRNKLYKSLSLTTIPHRKSINKALNSNLHV